MIAYGTKKLDVKNLCFNTFIYGLNKSHRFSDPQSDSCWKYAGQNKRHNAWNEKIEWPHMIRLLHFSSSILQ